MRVLVLTVCDSARERCPYFPAEAERLHHSFPDPAQATEDEILDRFRSVRDAIRDYAERLVAEQV